VKNRMLEIGTSGTVRGEDGNILTYSALLCWWWVIPRTVALSRPSRLRLHRISTNRVIFGPFAEGLLIP